MIAATSTTVVGVFNNRTDAERAIEELGRAGFTSGQIGMMSQAPEPDAATPPNVETDQVATGALVGVAAGAGIGGLVGLGVLAGVVPIVGPAIAAGTLGTLISNAAGGAAIVGVSGALIAWGVPEDHAKFYESQLKAGRVIVSVTTADHCEKARTILERHGAFNHQLLAKAPCREA
jgi:hypothetical protein